jgi:hypothetical protein
VSGDITVAQLPPEVENELVAELAQLALEQAAPEELVLFSETAAEYFSDRQALLNPRHHDEPVSFGLDMAMLTPYALALGTLVVRFLVSTVTKAVIAESKPQVARLVRRLFRHRDNATEFTDDVPPLSGEQLRRVREIAHVGAKRLRLDDKQANLLADALVGGLATR